jgi:malyl-CoA/(S)-citramalyl-CoA lyase
VNKTHRIIAAMKEAAANGQGAVSLDGRLIDAASIRMAETLLAKLEQIEARDQPVNGPDLRARRARVAR